MIKYIGQHIFDFIARFRNDIYLENIADGTVDSDKFLGLDSSGKIVKETVVSSSGDITGVDITVGTGLDISQTNTTSGDYSSTINLDLTEVGVSGSANQLLTDDGDGTVTSEANLTFDGSTLSIEADSNTTADALFIDCNSLTSGSAIHVDVDDASGTADFDIVNIQYDKSADNTSGNKVIKALNIELDDDATSNSGNTTMYGLHIDIDAANANGLQRHYGSYVDLSGGDTGDFSVGYYSQVEDGGVDFVAVSSANAQDKFKIATTTNGATTLTTFDADDALAHFEIAADGNITLDPAGTIALEANTTVTGDVITTGNIELGHASDTTLARSAAGKVTIEGNQIVTAGAVSVASGSQTAVGVQIARRTITQGEANAMDSTPIELIPAQGANTVIVILGGMIRVDRAATQTSASDTLHFHYEGEEPGTFGQSLLYHHRRFMYNETTDRVFHVCPALGAGGIEVADSLTEDVNAAVEASFSSAITNNSANSIDVYLNYQVIDIS